MELYCGNVKGMNLFGIYYDFFAFPEGTYGIVLTESSAKGAEGLICAAMLRGMVQSLINQHIEPIQLCETLNRLICKDRKDGIFTFGYLLLDPLNKNFKYISCGKTNLWKMSSSHLTLESGLTNPPLGEDKEVRFVQKESSFEPGDSLIFSSFIEDNLEEKASVFMEKIFQENGEMLVAKKIVDAVLRQAKLSLPKLLQDRSLSIIGLTLGVY